MKILYYSSHTQLSLSDQNGAGTHMREVIVSLRNQGHEVLPVIIADIISPPRTITISQQKSINGATIKQIFKKIIPAIVWRTVKELQILRIDKIATEILRKNVTAFNPEVIYERAAHLQTSGMKIARSEKIFHVMEINAPFIEEVKVFEKANTLLYNLCKRVEKMQVEFPNQVYVVSSALKKYYSSYLKDNSKIKVIPNAVNPLQIKVNEKLKGEIIKKYQLANYKVVGFVGSIFPYHGVDILIEAMAEVFKRKSDVKLLIVGDGLILDDLKKRCAELNIQDKVMFTGKVNHDDAYTYIDLMDIAVMAKSNWYGSPVKIFEYGAMGKPIIAPNTIPVKDVMVDGEDGLLIEPNQNELTNTIDKLLNDEKLRKKIALNFQSKVFKNHTWDKVVADVIESFKIKNHN